MDDLSHELQNIYKKILNVKNNSYDTENKAQIGKQEINMLLNGIKSVSGAFMKVSEKVNGLNQSISKIGGIADVINLISEQTNLLALNDAIEAARAGEVKKLAEQSKESTDKIQNLTYNIKSDTQNVIYTSNEVKEIVNQQTDIVQSTIEEIAASVQEVTAGVSEVASYASNLTDIVDNFNNDTSKFKI